MAWSTVKRQVSDLIAAVAAAGLLLSGAALAASPPDVGPPPLPDLSAVVAAQVAPLLPPSARLDAVELGCKPPPGAIVEQVAPGLSRLASRGFVIVLHAGDHNLACSATAVAQRPVLAAARDLEAGEPVTVNDVQPQWVDAFSGAPNALEQLPQAGLVAASPLRAGQALYPWQLTRPVGFRPGDLVTVMITNGPVTLRAMLEANSSAAVGDSATLINPDTRTPVAVTVTGPKTAELVMP